MTPHHRNPPRSLQVLHRLLGLVHRLDAFRVFRYPESGSRRMPATPAGFQVRIYDSLSAVPAEISRVVMPGRVVDLMRSRMRRGLARLLVVLDERDEVAAYGWNQSWAPFRRRFARVASHGAMLGFYWTRPDQRGRGLYHFLLRLSVALAAPDDPLYIYAGVGNEASLRGIAKAGFVDVMELHLRRVFWFMNFTAAVKDLSAGAASPAANEPPGVVGSTAPEAIQRSGAGGGRPETRPSAGSAPLPLRAPSAATESPNTPRR